MIISRSFFFSLPGRAPGVACRCGPGVCLRQRAAHRREGRRRCSKTRRPTRPSPGIRHDAKPTGRSPTMFRSSSLLAHAETALLRPVSQFRRVVPLIACRGASGRDVAAAGSCVRAERPAAAAGSDRAHGSAAPTAPPRPPRLRPTPPRPPRAAVPTAVTRAPGRWRPTIPADARVSVSAAARARRSGAGRSGRSRPSPRAPSFGDQVSISSSYLYRVSQVAQAGGHRDEEDRGRGEAARAPSRRLALLADAARAANDPAARDDLACKDYRTRPRAGACRSGRDAGVDRELTRSRRSCIAPRDKQPGTGRGSGLRRRVINESFPGGRRRVAV